MALAWRRGWRVARIDGRGVGGRCGRGRGGERSGWQGKGGGSGGGATMGVASVYREGQKWAGGGLKAWLWGLGEVQVGMVGGGLGL